MKQQDSFKKVTLNMKSLFSGNPGNGKSSMFRNIKLDSRRYHKEFEVPDKKNIYIFNVGYNYLAHATKISEQIKSKDENAYILQISDELIPDIFMVSYEGNREKCNAVLQTLIN